MTTLIASIANLAISVAKCTKERLRKTRQAMRIALGKADWGFRSFN